MTRALDSEGAVREVAKETLTLLYQVQRLLEENVRTKARDDLAEQKTIMAIRKHIAAHEPAPVDPLREIAASLFTCEDGRFYASETMIDEMTARLRARLPAAAVTAVEAAPDEPEKGLG